MKKYFILFCIIIWRNMDAKKLLLKKKKMKLKNKINKKKKKEARR
jgi:hypothetical protein